MTARLTLRSFILALAVLLVLISPSTARAADLSLCSGMVGEGRNVCFPASQIAYAEHQLPVVPIRPSGVVWSIAKLQIREAQLRFGREVHPRPFAIVYRYGRLPRDTHGMPDYGGTSPYYIAFQEMIGRIPNNRPGIDPSNPSGPSSWLFHANLRCHNLNILLESNEPKQVLKGVGIQFLRSEVCGKALARPLW